MNTANRFIILFFHDVPLPDVVESACGSLEGDDLAITLARLDEHSQRASMWVRDPMGCLPQGRLAIDAHDSNSAHLASIADSLGGSLYRCFGRTPVTPQLAVGETFGGTMQLCCFQRKANLSDATLRSRWFEQHTDIAIETQQTLGYRQNLVLDCGEPFFDGIVEEYFSYEAATDMTAFFADGHDETRMWQHIEALTKSSESFLDLDKSEVIHLTDTRLR
ncbi:MAG: hypothetical protein VW524_11925 [Halieaceae bacterium]|jgi:hypothetical protein